MRYGQRDKQWCGNHRINQKALLRAMSIRKQLKKYLDRFGIKVVSCEGDAKRLRRCLVSGYFKVSRTFDPSLDLQSIAWLTGSECSAHDAGRHVPLRTGRRHITRAPVLRHVYTPAVDGLGDIPRSVGDDQELHAGSDGG